MSIVYDKEQIKLLQTINSPNQKQKGGKPNWKSVASDVIDLQSAVESMKRSSVIMARSLTQSITGAEEEDEGLGDNVETGRLASENKKDYLSNFKTSF